MVDAAFRSLSALLNGWLLVVAKKHTGLVYNSRENSFPDCRWIHSIWLGLGSELLSAMLLLMFRQEVDAVAFGARSSDRQHFFVSDDLRYDGT